MTSVALGKGDEVLEAWKPPKNEHLPCGKYLQNIWTPENEGEHILKRSHSKENDFVLSLARNK